MRLEIEGELREFVPLSTFRGRWKLPSEFGVAYFEPKDWDVGAMDYSSHETLKEIKHAVVAGVPKTLLNSDLLLQPQRLAAIFREKLQVANVHIGLNEDQLDFAVDGFQNILQNISYDLIRLQQTYRDPLEAQRQFNFDAIYQQWLNDSVTIFAKTYTYAQAGTDFEIRIISYVYGRMGFQARVAGDTYYVLDMTLACPAWRFMGQLSRSVAESLCKALAKGID